MEHDLTGLLDQAYKFSTNEVKLIMMQLLKVLEYMHNGKYVHRDLKCSNLLLSHNLELKLADFGLARSIEPQYTGPKTLDRLTNTVITLWYRSHPLPAHPSARSPARPRTGCRGRRPRLPPPFLPLPPLLSLPSFVSLFGSTFRHPPSLSRPL